jgi:hypothetical protein
MKAPPATSTTAFGIPFKTAAISPLKPPAPTGGANVGGVAPEIFKIFHNKMWNTLSTTCELSKLSQPDWLELDGLFWTGLKGGEQSWSRSKTARDRYSLLTNSENHSEEPTATFFYMNLVTDFVQSKIEEREGKSLTELFASLNAAFKGAGEIMYQHMKLRSLEMSERMCKLMVFVYVDTWLSSGIELHKVSEMDWDRFASSLSTYLSDVGSASEYLDKDFMQGTLDHEKLSNDGASLPLACIGHNLDVLIIFSFCANI